MEKRAFTIKSVIFSLIGLLLVAAFPPFSSKVLKLNGAIQGYLPIVPLLLIFILSLGWNLLFGFIWQRAMLSSKELAVVFCVMLSVAWIPEMQGTLTRNLILPRYEEARTNASWKEAELTARLPDFLFPAAEAESASDDASVVGAEQTRKPDDDQISIGTKVHDRFIQGKLSRREIPFKAWVSPLLHWSPFFVLLSLVMMAMTFLVHRQWTVHEQLRYPLAAVSDALIKRDRPGMVSALYRNRLFWFSFVFVVGFHLLRYLNAWFPNELPKVLSEYGLDWQRIFPVIAADRSNTGPTFLLSWMPISFAVIGIAYFVPADVSLTMGLTAPLGTLLGVLFYAASGEPVASSDLETMRAGGFIGFGLILAYTGRTYYLPVLAKAILPGLKRKTDHGGVMAARLFLLTYALLVYVVSGMGAGPLPAFVIVTFVLLIFLVVTRLVCETGLPSIAPAWSLQALLTGLFGPAALGPAAISFVTLLGGTVVASASSQLFMPYMATSLKVLDDNKVNLRRFAVVAKIAILLALVVGFIATLGISYSNGEEKLTKSERGILSQGVHEILNLKDTGQLEAAEAAHGFEKLALLRPDGDTTRLVLFGLIAVLATYLLRFRFSKWPIHPLFFVVLGAKSASTTWFCFLLGWGVKSLVVKFGGGRSYRNLKPLFIGLIVGEFLIFGISFVVGTLYYKFTGQTPVSIWML